MTALELPHINVLSKVDLLESKAALSAFLDRSMDEVINDIAASDESGKHSALTSAIGSLINDYGMVNFLGLDPTEEESIDLILMSVDHAIQYHDDVEPKEPRDEEEDAVDEEEEEA